MDDRFSRRGLLQGAAVLGGAVVASSAAVAGPISALRERANPGWVLGRLTGAQAVAHTLSALNVGCVYGIPGAQENELWDEFKSQGVEYLLVTHEFSAACMADGYARATGLPGVVCVVPGPGVTNTLTGLGEALLDSIPVVAIVGDVGNGAKARPFQVHSLPQAELLKPVCKAVYCVSEVGQIADTIRRAFERATMGEPGPTAVVIPYNLLIEVAAFASGPLPQLGTPFDATAAGCALSILRDPRLRVGIYAGLGCMDASAALTRVAEVLQAPVATSVSGKGAIPECHPLAVGWGYGPHASSVAETIFQRDPLHPLRSGIDVLLAIGVKFSEVSTGYYGNPRPRTVIHVDANPQNLGQIMPADVAVEADANAFLQFLLQSAETIRRPCDDLLQTRIRRAKAEQDHEWQSIRHGANGVDPLALVVALRQVLPENGLVFVDVSASEHLAAEYIRTTEPRTYFNPVDNQSMGWSIPAAIGAQKILPGRKVVTITGDGCFLMSAMELSTAARAGLPVKFIVLDDQTYHYMQMLQEPAYRRTTATQLAVIDYAAFAKAVGVTYFEICHGSQLEATLQGALCHPGPALVRVSTDYGNRKIRWIEAVRKRYTNELSATQKARFLARIGQRTFNLRREKND